MKAIKLTLAIGIVLVSASPAFSQFVKAALGFRLGYSPTEQGYYQKGYAKGEKKGIGVQVHSVVNNGGLQAAGSGYGVGFGGASGGRSLGGGPLDAHVGKGAVKHLRILGLNLYLGGRAAHGIGQHGGGYKPPLVKKPIYNLVNQHQHPQPNYLHALSKPISLGAGVGAGLKPVVQQAPNGGKILGGAGGVRAAVGTPGFGLGFNLGYKQGINTKSPLGLIFGLGGPGKYLGPVYKGPVYKGQDQVYIPGSGILKGHGHDLSHSPPAQNSFFGPFAGLESKQQISTIPATAINTQAQAHQQQQHQQLQTQASHPQSQQTHSPGKHQGLQGPLSPPSSYPRNPFLALFQARPSILRPTRYQYNFNSPQSLPSGPIRMILSPHPPTPAPQRPQSAVPNDMPPPSWSTLFPLGGPQIAATNSFINPIPPNGQSLAKLQATLRPGSHFHPQAAQVQSAQHQVPFIHQAQYHQPQKQYQGFFSQPVQGNGHFGHPISHQPQNNFQHYFSSGFGQQQQPTAAPQFSQEFQSLFQQSPLQSFQQLPQLNFQQQSLIPQQSPYFNQIQEQPVQAAAPSTAQAKQSNVQNIAGLPFNTEAMPFAPEAGYKYSHSTVSQPVKMAGYTMHMDLTNNVASASNEPSQAGSDVPMFGPMGRRLKKAKKPRQDVIIKKQGDVEGAKNHHDIMETSASTNAITLISSIGPTSWTPITVENAPKLEKKSLETPVAPNSQVNDVKKQAQQQQQAPKLQQQSIAPTGVSALHTAPAPALGPQDHEQERGMILKKRRLNVSSAEVLNSPTVIPTSTSTSSAPSSTTSTTTISPSSSSYAPSSVDPSTVPETTSQSSQSPVTTTVVSA